MVDVSHLLGTSTGGERNLAGNFGWATNTHHYVVFNKVDAFTFEEKDADDLTFDKAKHSARRAKKHSYLRHSEGDTLLYGQ